MAEICSFLSVLRLTSSKPRTHIDPPPPSHFFNSGCKNPKLVLASLFYFIFVSATLNKSPLLKHVTRISWLFHLCHCVRADSPLPDSFGSFCVIMITRIVRKETCCFFVFYPVQYMRCLPKKKDNKTFV